MHPKMSPAAKKLLNITDELSIEAISVDPEEQSDLGQHCLPEKLLKHFSRREKQTTFVAISALRVITHNSQHLNWMNSLADPSLH